QRSKRDRLIEFDIGQGEVSSWQARADAGHHVIWTTGRSVRSKYRSRRHAAAIRHGVCCRDVAGEGAAWSASRSSESYRDPADRIAGLGNSGLQLRWESRVGGRALTRTRRRADCVVDLHRPDVKPSINNARKPTLVGCRWRSKGRVACVDSRAAGQHEMCLGWPAVVGDGSEQRIQVQCEGADLVSGLIEAQTAIGIADKNVAQR